MDREEARRYAIDGAGNGWKHRRFPTAAEVARVRAVLSPEDLLGKDEILKGAKLKAYRHLSAALRSLEWQGEAMRIGRSWCATEGRREE